jgi:pyruvate kinase
VIASLDAVLSTLRALLDGPLAHPAADASPVSFEAGARLLEEHADSVLGPLPRAARTRIMVTMPGEAADDPKFIAGLLDAGMDIMRINCAHDSPEVWQRMAERLRATQAERGGRCLIECELADPKLRTGPIEPGPAVVKWRPLRNKLGQVIEEARAPGRDDACASGRRYRHSGRQRFPRHGEAGDRITLVDARGRKRVLHVCRAGNSGCLCETDRTA